MRLRKVFRFRMEPTGAQREALARMAGARRFVWNGALNERKQCYAATGKGLPGAELSRRLTERKQQPELAWLKEADSQALQQVLADLQRAYVNFFEKRARLPRFKSRKRDRARFRIPQRVAVVNEQVIVPKIGEVRIRQSQPIDGTTKSATFKRDSRYNWDVTPVSEFDMPDAALPPAEPCAVIGVDLGLKDFAVLSDGSRIAAPRFYRSAQRKLRRAQRAVARRKLRSANWAKAQQRAARVQAKTANQRKDSIHKVTTELVRNYEGVCIEDLSVRGLAKTKLAKSVLDAGLGEFRRQLGYKDDLEPQAPAGD